MQSGGSIRPGATGADGDVGTLTLNSFTVQGGDLRFDLVRPTATNDLINVLGPVSFNNPSTVSFTSVPATGNYTLITSTTPISLGVTPTFNVPTGTRATFDFDTTDPNKLGLIVGSAPKSLTWTGTAGSAWDLSATINWSDNGGTTTNEKFFNLDSVTFGNVAANRNVNLDDVVLPSAVTVNNNAGNDYTISSATGLGGIGGTASLTKSGAGKLTITVNNIYTGPTTINGGTIQVGSAGTTGSLGTGPISNNGTLAFNRSDAIAVANDISGSGALQHLGPDALIVTGANTYSGTTTITSGTLQVGDGGATGTLGTGAVTNNGILSFNRSDAITVANAINGTGALQQSGAGTTTLTGASGYTGATNINAGTLNFTNLSNLGAGTAINFAGGTLQYAASAGNIDLSIRTLTMGAGGGTIDTNGNNVTFANSIGNAGAGGFTKAGAGTLTLNAPINYVGTTSVIGGTVVPGVANALGNNTNALNLGLAAGAGTLDLTSNGATVTTLTASSNVAAATNLIQIGSGKTLTVNGNVAIGTLTGGATVTNLTVTGAGGTLSTGTPGGTFAVGNISNAANSATSSATLDLSALGTFVANYGASGAIGIGTSPTATAGNGPNGTLILAGSNTLTAGTLRVSFGSNNGGTSNLRLGAANTINVDNLYVATGKGAGNLLFATGLVNPSLTLRAADGVARVALMRLGDYSDYTAGGASTLSNGVVNFTGGTVNAMVNDLTIGVGRIAGQNGGAATAAGTLTFDKGTIDATTITLGRQSDITTSPTPAGAAAAGTINVAGNASLIIGPGGITLGAGTPLGGAAASLFAGTLNVTGGTVTSAADIVDGGGASTVTLNGGALDLQNHNLGTDSPIDTLNFQAGTLKNVAQINAGTSGLTKTTTGTLTVAGTNAFTGPTTVNAGTLSVTGSIANSSGVTVNTGGTFDAAAAQRVNALTVNGGQARVVSAPTKFVLTVGDGTQSTSQLSLTGGKLDLMTNGLAVRYAAGNDAAVLDSVRAQIIAGYNPSTPTAGDGKWDGTTGITSSSIGSLTAVGYALAADVLPFANGTSDTFLGTTVDKNTVIARYTLSGDVNLDGSVNFLDLAKLAQSYNVTDGTRQWSTGDVNYDGNTDFLDLAKLAQNYNTALPSAPIPGASADFNADLARAFASIPEPGTLAILGLTALSLLTQRRRSATSALSPA